MVDIALPYFVATPASAPPWPGVVVIHEGNGISPQLLRVCQRLAAEGFAAIAPDLFFRTGGTGAGDFATMMGALDDERTSADIEEAAGILQGLGAERLGITGFCMGGRWTWHMATTSTTFSAAAGFYGAGIGRELQPPHCPTLLFFGDRDEWVPMEQIEQIRAAHAGTVVYEGAEHGFMRDGSENFHETAAADAWGRMLALFGDHLR
jgi:carboxymethylenebutenolidase